MGNEQHRETEFPLQVAEQVQDLCPYGDIKRGHGLVGDQHLRIDGESPRDADSLTLAARKLVWITVGRLFAQAGQPEKAVGPPECIVAAVSVDDRTLSDRRSDFLPRIQRAEGILQDDLDPGPQFAKLPPRDADSAAASARSRPRMAAAAR